MSWRDGLQKASFRGVTFLTGRPELETGRRVALHEYPKKDEPRAEDMGRKARVFAFEAFVLGDDYISQARALLAACETKDAGRLVHPSWGATMALCTACHMTEDFATAGRMASFALTFQEDPTAGQDGAGGGASSAGAGGLSITEDTSTSVTLAADDADADISDGFADEWDCSGISDISASATEDVAAATDALSDMASQIDLSGAMAALAKVRSLPGYLLSIIPGLGLTSRLSSFRSLINSYLNLPAQLAAQVTGLISSFTGALGLGGASSGLWSMAGGRGAGSPHLAIADLFVDPSGAGSNGSSSGGAALVWPPLPTGTAAGAVDQVRYYQTAAQIQASNASAALSLNAISAITSQASITTSLPTIAPVAKMVANRVALAALIRRMALVEAARVAATVTPTNKAEALAISTDLAARLDAEVIVLGNQTPTAARRRTMSSLTRLKVAVQRDMSQRAATLADLVTYRNTSPIPAIVLAARLYDDPARAGEIVTRNGVAHPGFVPAINLEVLAQ